MRECPFLTSVAVFLARDGWCELEMLIGLRICDIVQDNLRIALHACGSSGWRHSTGGFRFRSICWQAYLLFMGAYVVGHVPGSGGGVWAEWTRG